MRLPGMNSPDGHLGTASVTPCAVAGSLSQMDRTPVEHWYAIRVRSRFEITTSTALRCKGFEAFLPTYRDSRRWSDRVKPLDIPLFPGYVFCRFQVSDLLRVLNTSGVVHVVSTGARPSPVDEMEIASVRAICATGLPAVAWPQVTEGQRLIVSRGPLKGTEGIVVEVRDHFRLVAAISLLQRAVAIELEREWITPVSLWETGNPAATAP
jgi:transcription antitermination factor NusG